MLTKILIAEDETYSRQSMVKQLKKFDKGEEFQIFEACNGKQGLKLFIEEEPELIFTDIKMPFLNGLEFLRAMLIQKSDAKVIIVSAYADFAYAREALNLGALGYLLKPIKDEELDACLKKFVKQNDEKKEKDCIYESDILTKHIYKNIMGSVVEHDFIIDNLFGKMFKQYLIIGIYFTDGRHPQKEDFLLELKKIQGQDIWTGFRMMNITKKHWALVLNAGEPLDFLLRRMSCYLEEGGYEYYIGVSDLHQSVDEVKAAYQQSLTAIMNKIFCSNKILYFKEISSRRRENDYEKEQELEKIRLCMEQGNGVNACLNINKVIDGLFANEHLEVNTIEVFLMGLSAMFHYVMEKYVDGGEKKYSDFLKFSILDFDSKEELEKALHNKVMYLCTQVKEKSLSHSDHMVEALLDYVNKNYNKEISLKDLADNVFFINHTYLSHIFTEKTGNSYSNYLRKVRVERAKEYLKDKSYTITQVASFSGYNDSSQFIRVFKQEVGMTPKKYRNLVGGDSP